MDGSVVRTYLAAVAPPQPPPTTTTRRFDLGSISPLVEAHPARPDTASAPTPVPDALRNCLRVIRVMERSSPEGCRRQNSKVTRTPHYSSAPTMCASSFQV